MKSGDFDYEYNWPAAEEDFANILDFDFVQNTFTSKPSLRARKGSDGWIKESEFKGQPFDESEFEIVLGAWNHEHCTLCLVAITGGMTFWTNQDDIVILCDKCYEHFETRIRDSRSTQVS